MYSWNTDQFVLCRVLNNAVPTTALGVEAPHAAAGGCGKSSVKAGPFWGGGAAALRFLRPDIVYHLLV